MAKKIESTELIPPKGDGQVGYKVFNLLALVLKDKSNLGLPGKWNSHYKLSRGKHWAKKSKKVSLVTANLLFTHRQRTVNMLTDNNPTFNVVKLGNPDEIEDEIYDDLLHTAEHWWTDQEQQAVLEKSIINGETYGCTIEKVVFNPDLEFGMGEAETQLVDPHHFGFYPVKSKEIQKCDALFHYWPINVREAKRRWPGFEIVADSEYLEELGDSRREIMADTTKGALRGYFTTFAGIIKNMLSDSSELQADDQELLVCECWVKDYSKNKEGGPNYTGNIRVVTTLNGGKIVVEDKDNPSINPNLEPDQAIKTYLYDKYPFTLTQSVTDTSLTWGVSDYEQLETLQIEVNKTLSQFTQIKDKVSRIKIINPKDSGVDNSEFTNAPGIINPSSWQSAQGIRYMDPPKIPADLIKAIEIYKDIFMLISGAFELEQAQTPGKEVIAYKAIAALLEHVITMLKGKIRNYSVMIRDRGRMYLSHVMNFYTEDRWIPHDDDGSEVRRAVNGPKLIIPAKLTVVSGSTMPRSKIAEREEAVGLADKGHIDTRELLKKLGWTDWKAVVKRMEAGPIGEVFEKLAGIGVPPEILDYFNEIAQMDTKDFEKALEKGEIAPFTSLMEAYEGEETPDDPLQTSELEKNAAEIRAKDAEVQKTMKEIELLEAEIQSEYVEQKVKAAGVGFDAEKLVIERAQTVADIKTNEEQGQRDSAKLIAEIETQKKETKKTVKKKVKKTGGDDSDLKGKSAETNTQGAFREKGLSSNNLKKE